MESNHRTWRRRLNTDNMIFLYIYGFTAYCLRYLLHIYYICIVFPCIFRNHSSSASFVTYILLPILYDGNALLFISEYVLLIPILSISLTSFGVSISCILKPSFCNIISRFLFRAVCPLLYSYYSNSLRMCQGGKSKH